MHVLFLPLVEATMRGQVILSHGLDASPAATKVSALAALAESLGWQTFKPDYREDDVLGHADCVPPRLARLLAAIDAQPRQPLVLVGSSMGAFVSGLASLQRPVAGLFLLATPSEIPGHSQAFDLRSDVPAFLMHGWNDDVCPPAGVIAFAGKRKLPLLMLDDDHRLGASMATIESQFRQLLGAWA
jgi:predicted alpha/beta-hydrolase family hydrolase